MGSVVHSFLHIHIGTNKMHTQTENMFGYCINCIRTKLYVYRGTRRRVVFWDNNERDGDCHTTILWFLFANTAGTCASGCQHRWTIAGARTAPWTSLTFSHFTMGCIYPDSQSRKNMPPSKVSATSCYRTCVEGWRTCVIHEGVRLSCSQGAMSTNTALDILDLYV